MSLKRNEDGRFLPSKTYAQDLDHESIIQKYKCGQKIMSIAREVNSYPKKIQKILKSNGIEFRKKQCYLSGEDNPRYTGHKEMQGAYLATLKASAKNRGIEFSVTYEYIWNLFLEQDRKCKYSGITIFFSRNNIEHIMGQATASLDRIDSSKGYIEGNLQWLHKRINIMKGNMSEKEFLDFCEAVTLKNKGQTIMKTLTHSESKVKNG
jgi:hypothetical protein